MKEKKEKIPTKQMKFNIPASYIYIYAYRDEEMINIL